MEEPLTSKRAPVPVGPYPHARRAGNLLFLSGIGPRVPGRSDVPGVTLGPDGRVTSYDFESQCRQVFENVRVVLEDAGSSWDRIVDVAVYLTDIGRDFAEFNRLYAIAFPDPGNRPTRTTVEVTRLPTPIAVELKVIATI
jgi:2-aminomuconate deaminase